MIFHTNFSKFLKKSKMIDSNFRISSFQKIDLRIYPNNFSFHLYRRDSLGPSILYKNADPSLNNIYDTVRSNIIQNGCYDPSVGCFCLFHRVLCVAVGDWYRRLKKTLARNRVHTTFFRSQCLAQWHEILFGSMIPVGPVGVSHSHGFVPKKFSDRGKSASSYIAFIPIVSEPNNF